MTALSLDTNALIWWLGGSTRLPERVVDALSGDSTVFVSVATIWEIEVKRHKGQGPVPLDFDLEAAIGRDQLRLVPIRFEDATCAARLPMHHKDPFDRLIVAQAMNDGATLVTSDRQLAAYDVLTILI